LANIFVHFEPNGHSLRHNAAQQGRGLDAAHEKYRDALARGQGGHENEATEDDENEATEDDKPVYIVAGSSEAARYQAAHGDGHKSKRNSATTGSQQTAAHLAAQDGDLITLKKAVEGNKSLVNAKDVNGWTPLHGKFSFDLG